VTAVAEAHVAHQDFDEALDDGFILGLLRPRRDHGGFELRGELGVPGVEVGVVQMALEHALLQAVGDRHVRHAAEIGEHAPMAREPVAALHVLGRPGVEQLTEAEAGHEHPGFADLAGLDLDPLDRIAGVIDLDAFAGRELARGDGGFSVLRELAVKLLPEVRVGGERLGTLLPQELQRMPEPQVVHDRWPVDLTHPQRIAPRSRGIRRATRAIPDFAHGAPRTAQGLGDLAQAPALGEAAPDLLVPLHRHAPKRHAALSFVVTHEGCGTRRWRSGDEDSDIRYRSPLGGEGREIQRLGRYRPDAMHLTYLGIGGPSHAWAQRPEMAPPVVPN